VVFSSATEVQIVFKPFLMLIAGQHFTSFEKRYIYGTLDYFLTKDFERQEFSKKKATSNDCD